MPRFQYSWYHTILLVTQDERCDHYHQKTHPDGDYLVEQYDVDIEVKLLSPVSPLENDTQIKYRAPRTPI